VFSIAATCCSSAPSFGHEVVAADDDRTRACGGEQAIDRIVLQDLVEHVGMRHPLQKPLRITRIGVGHERYCALTRDERTAPLKSPSSLTCAGDVTLSTPTAFLSLSEQ
jgi:hypothetical protein